MLRTISMSIIATSRRTMYEPTVGTSSDFRGDQQR